MSEQEDLKDFEEEPSKGEVIEPDQVILQGVSPDSNFGALLPKADLLPEQLGIIAVQHRPLFPHMVIPLVVEGDIYQKTLNQAQKEQDYVGIFLAKPQFDAEDPKVEHLHKVGVVARIAKVFAQDDHGSQVLLDVLERVTIVAPIEAGTKSVY